MNTITNEDAGLYLLAFDLKRPWATHRKYQVFEDDHSEIFGRPAVDSHRIVFLHLLAERITAAIPRLNNTLFSKYALTKYLLLYIIRLLLEKDSPVGVDTLMHPEKYVANKRSRDVMIGCIDRVLNDVIIDLNAELDQVGDDFDYRGKLRDETWVKGIAHRLVADYAKLVARGRIDSFSTEFDEARQRKVKEKT